MPPMPMQNPSVAPAVPAVPPPAAAPVPHFTFQMPTIGGNAFADLPAEATVEQLQVQAALLDRQLAGLHQARDNIDRVLNSERRRADLPPEARAQMEQARGDLEVQIAQFDRQHDNVRERIASQRGVPMSQVEGSGQIVPREPRRRGPDPEMIAGLSFTLLMVFAVPMSIAWARRLWRSKPAPPSPKLDEVAARMERLEQAVDAIAIETERISEGQRFVTKLFAERPAAATPGGQGMAQGATPANLDAGGAPVLALGAGSAPAEAIRMPDRQSVRSGITPH